MRAPPFPPDQMSPEVRVLHDKISAGVEKKLTGFVSKRADGALIGPFAIMLRFPTLGDATWDFAMKLMEGVHLPGPVREVAILATAAVLNPRYEIYAHEKVAAVAGLSSRQISAIVAGQRPTDLGEDGEAAYDLASVLAKGRQAPETTYQRAAAAFGEEGAASLIFLVGGYAMLSTLLNAYDVSVPGREDGVPEG